MINSSLSSNPIGGDTRTVFSLLNGAELIIGDGVGISNAAVVCHHRVVIGEGAQIGGSVRIYDTDFHTLDAGRRSGADMLEADRCQGIHRRPQHRAERRCYWGRKHRRSGFGGNKADTGS